MNTDAIAAGITREYRLARQDGARAVDHAILCGKLLRLVKRKLGPGEFWPWVEQHCELSRRTAKRYMRAAVWKGTGLSLSSIRSVLASPGAAEARGAGLDLREISAT